MCSLILHYGLGHQRMPGLGKRCAPLALAWHAHLHRTVCMRLSHSRHQRMASPRPYSAVIKEKELLADGVIKIKVELSDIEIYDM